MKDSDYLRFLAGYLRDKHYTQKARDLDAIAKRIDNGTVTGRKSDGS